MIHHGDCVEVMAGMDADSIDAIVTDPPSGIHFMSKDWDHDRGGRTAWVAWMTGVMSGCLRVLKPGGWMLCWSLPRTSHWTAWAIEDAGFKLTDVVMHVFAQGFPKGRGQLKPAYEPWILARKPGPLQPLQIDAARIPGEPWQAHDATGLASVKFFSEGDAPVIHKEPHDAGRWPANLMLSPDAPIFDGGWEGVVGGGEQRSGFDTNRPDRQTGTVYGSHEPSPFESHGDTGTYSRFFMIPKASRSDREPVMPGLLEERSGHLTMNSQPTGIDGPSRRNVHPTVKPTSLMRHLVRLVTPPGGTVLDPFAGSGTTLLAAEQEGFAWVGIEREEEYVNIIGARLQGNPRGLGLAG